MAFELQPVLKASIKAGASDIHLKVGVPPMFRIDGRLRPLKEVKRLTPEDLSRVATSIMSGAQRERFKKQLDIDLAYGVPGVGRFRVNIFLQRGSVGVIFRVIPYRVPSIDNLLLPPIIKKIANERRGLILVTGATGSGKSTTLAAMISHINNTRRDHIVTIEDPIEFLIRDKKSIISQREIGSDSHSFHGALRAALRQDPNVILIGEMRDLETIEIALTGAETGHLVMSTMHTMDASETVSRIISAFPVHQQTQARAQVATLTKAVICQRLVPRKDGKGRVPAIEVMLSTARIRELMMDETRHREIADAIAEGHSTYGMQTFDQSLMWLLNHDLITYEEALLQTSNRDDFALRVSGIEGASSGDRWESFSGGTTSPGASSGQGRTAGDDFEIERF
jgi:twitching motility protein PilT